MAAAAARTRPRPLSGGQTEDAGLADLVGQVVDDAKALARAEANVAKARASAKLRRIKGAAIAFGTGVALMLVAVIALGAGTVAILLPLVGPVLATLIAVAFYVLAAAVAFFVGKRML